jgi:phosphoribosylformimino-5-aminoimidazole carboxamide ribonucleotide (ProFAR) isomerase
MVRSVVFEVIPAIDLAGGRLARFTQDGPRALDAFGGDPVSAAEAAIRAGARWLHVVDMDLAYAGIAANLRPLMAIRRAARFAGVLVEAAGGVKTAEDVDLLLDAGVDRVVLGSAALTDADLVATLVERLGERLAIGIEAHGDLIRPRGSGGIELPLADTLAWLAELRPARFVVTAVARVGGVTGPDLGVLGAAVELESPVVAAGGIASVPHLEAVRAAGCDAALVGRAALEGTMDLSAAIASLRAP